MNENKEIKCIYCGRGVLDGVQLSDSDIIPEALTNRKIINKCVCRIDHNNKFSDKFESKVINDLAYLRNRLGMFGKNSSLPKYDAKYEIGDITLEKKNVTNREELFNGKIVSGVRNGENVKFGNIENLKKITSYEDKEFIEIGLNDCEITENITFCLKTLFCDEALRMAAKVGYEWYCKQNNIKSYFPEFKDIVSFIDNGVAEASDIVEIVINTELYKIINSQVELGGHALSIIHSSDRNIYVLFSFFGLIIYKIKIKHAVIDFTNRKAINFFGLRYDGSETGKIEISLSSEYLEETSTKPDKAIEIMKDYILENFRQILEMQLFTLKNFKFTIDEINDILQIENEEDRYNHLIGFHNERRLMALFVLYHLGEHKEQFDTSINFNSNLKRLFDVDDKIVLDKTVFETLQNLYKQQCFSNYISVGIDIFYTAYKKECE